MLPLKTARRFVGVVVPLCLLLSLAGCGWLREATAPQFDVEHYAWPTPQPVSWRTPGAAEYVLPDTERPFLIVVDPAVADSGDQESRVAEMAALLRHFSRDVHWVTADWVRSEDVDAAAAVVYIGENEPYKLPASTLRILGTARALIWIGYHLTDVKRFGGVFAKIEPAQGPALATKDCALSYRGQSYVTSGTLRVVHVEAAYPADVLASLQCGPEEQPLLIKDGSAYFVATTDHLMLGQFNSTRDLLLLAFADMLNDAVGMAPSREAHQGLLQVDGFSWTSDPQPLAAAIGLLYQRGVPYGVRLAPKALEASRIDPYLLRIFALGAESRRHDLGS